MRIGEKIGRMRIPGVALSRALAGFVLGLAIAAPSIAAWQPSLASGTVVEAAERLKAGEYLWAPQIAPEGPVLIVISRTTQRAIVYRNGIPIGITTVSTGRPGNETPTGIFTILQKDADHRSNLYDDAPMPFMQRLTWGGVALHAGQLPGYPASHGCIRLPYEFARALFGVTRLGLTVVITDEAALPWAAPGTAPFSVRVSPTTAPEFVWQPERSPAGPISMVISASDGRMIVLRNGVLIGSASIALEGGVRETSAWMLKTEQGGSARWLRLPLPGQAGFKSNVTEEDRRKFSAPEGFRKALVEIVGPGTTVVVTNDSLEQSGTGDKVTVLEAEDPTGSAPPD